MLVRKSVACKNYNVSKGVMLQECAFLVPINAANLGHLPHRLVTQCTKASSFKIVLQQFRRCVLLPDSWCSLGPGSYSLPRPQNSSCLPRICYCRHDDTQAMYLPCQVKWAFNSVFNVWGCLFCKEISSLAMKILEQIVPHVPRHTSVFQAEEPAWPLHII